MTKILAVDPGITTGYVWADVNLDTGEVNRVIKRGELSYHEDKDIKTLMKFAKQADVIVVEDFVLRESLIGDRLLTVRLIGLLELTFRNKVIFQQPIQKAEFPDQRLRKMGLTHKSLHTRDALRHLLIYLSSRQRRTGTLKAKALKLKQKRIGK